MTWLVYTALEALYPRTAMFPGAADCDLAAFLDRFRRETTTLMWLGVVIGAILFHLSPIFTVFIPVPAFLLPRRLADRHASLISGSSVYLVRQAIFVLKLPAGLAWGAHPEVRKRLSLPPLARDPGTWKTG